MGTSGLTGRELYDILREKYHLQMEMAAMDYVIAMTSVMDTDEGFERLIRALKEIDLWSSEQKSAGRAEAKTRKEKCRTVCLDIGNPAAVYSVREALSKRSVPVDLEKCPGRISGEFIYLYPRESRS